jgi:hypothetical protein
MYHKYFFEWVMQYKQTQAMFNLFMLSTPIIYMIS